MPSVPQSLLWISLVVLWLFVLVPMLVNKRDAVRRTSDVALATRVLNGGAGARLLKRGGPAVGHRSDPEWASGGDEHVDCDDDLDQPEDRDDAHQPGSVVVQAAVVDVVQPDYLDVDVVNEDVGALPAGSGLADAPAAVLADGVVDSVNAGVEDTEATSVATDEASDELDDGYELVEDTAGLEPGEEPSAAVRPRSSRRHHYDSMTAEAVSARKYKFRKRVLITMALILISSAAAAFAGQSFAWWICWTATGGTVLYLGYLRRQTRIEGQVRQRRVQRLSRSQLGVDPAYDAYDRDGDFVPSRARRRDTAVLQADDEDFMFEHLDRAMHARGFGWPRDLPRAAGQ